MQILILNCGSSSAKFAVMDPASGVELIAGLAQRLGSPQASLDWQWQGQKHTRALPGADHQPALRAVVALLHEVGLAAGINGVGHRVLHGGARFSDPALVTPAVIAGIEACIPLGPLHNPHNLLGIRIAQEFFPGLSQVAVFDTAFHATMPPCAYLYAVPMEWAEQHQARRYGFHGTSHRFVAADALTRLGLTDQPSGIITVHLGNGCSCAAVRDGRSVDTTMGLTPLEGVVMGTRSGSVDPALIGYMAKRLELPADKIIDLLNKQSGLQGLSGLSNDMRTLVEHAEQGHKRARLAIEVFCYVLAKTIAGLVVPLGRLDAVVFTGGIGENSVPVRAKVVELLGFLGLSLDVNLNAGHGRTAGGRITTGSGPCALVVPTNEELMIARDTAALVA